MSNILSGNYRPDIDGLRSLAVISVVTFHAGFNRLAPGGFVGVDIFFVISGYLITGMIFKDIKNNCFSIREFYSRRIRRIFPALFVMYIVCAILSLAINFPTESEVVGKSTIYSIFFISNVFFYNSSNYFSSAMEANPLLHTWSLSVEEQFYVLFPLVAFAMRRLRHKPQVMVVSAFALASFGWSTLSVLNEPTAAFYLVQYRAWELLIGAFLALAQLPTPGKPWLLECAGALGILLILMSVLLLSPASLFPGPSALGACLGAAILIYSGSAYQTFAAKLLSTLPLRFIGLISYSLYLWHWPIIVFARQLHDVSGRGEKAALVAASVLIAAISWWFIERPFRQKPLKLSSNVTLGIGGALMLIISLLALCVGPINRMIWETPNRAEELLAYENYDANESMRVGKCFLTSGYNKFSMFDNQNCLRTDPSKLNYLLIGDSHAAHLWIGLQETYPRINFMQATASGCKPILGTEGEKRCTDLIQYIFDNFLPSNHFDGLILSARWTTGDVEAALRTSAVLSKYANRIIISGPIQEYDLSLPRVLALAATKRTEYDKFVVDHRKSEPLAADAAFASSKLPNRVTYMSAYKAVGAAECSPFTPEGVPVQFDYGHLTVEGSRCVAKRFNSALSLPQPQPECSRNDQCEGERSLLSSPEVLTPD